MYNYMNTSCSLTSRRRVFAGNVEVLFIYLQVVVHSLHHRLSFIVSIYTSTGRSRCERPFKYIGRERDGDIISEENLSIIHRMQTNTV